VATQNADHTFTMHSAVNLSACGSSDDERLFGLAILDVDRDGMDDILTTVSYGGLGAAPAGLALLRGGASGLGLASCKASAAVNTPGYPASLASAQGFYVADYDGDGKRDLVSTSPSSQLQYFHNSSAAMFDAVGGTAATPSWRVTFATPHGLLNANIHSDGTGTDIVRLTVNSSGVTSHPVATVAESGDSFGTVHGVVAGDLNGDGLLDTLIVGNHSGSGPDEFSTACDRALDSWDVATGTFGATVKNLRTIDVDGDGRDEVLAVTGTDAVIYAIR
jgi:hypothetical protein